MNADRTAQIVDIAFHHVHAHAATGKIADLVGGGKSRLEDQIVDAFFGQFVLVAHQPVFNGLLQDFLPVESGAVIDDTDDDIAALVLGAEFQTSLFGFTGGCAHFRRFESVIQGIAYQVHQWIADFFQHGLVHFGLLTGEYQIHFIAHLVAQVAYQPGEAVEGDIDGQHAKLKHVFLQFPGIALELGEAVEQGLRAGSATLGLVQACLVEHGLGDYKFAHKVDQKVHFFDGDANGSAFTVG